MGIMEVITWQKPGHKKSRFQVLAARFPSVMNPNDMMAAREEMNNAGLDRDDIDRMFNRCDEMDGAGLGASESQLVTVILVS